MRARPSPVTFLAVAAVCASIAHLATPTVALGQHGGIICCNQLIDVGGDWVTADRHGCIDYMNQSTASRAKVCAHLLRGECAASVDADDLGVDSLLALLLPATAHAQCVSSAGTPVGCGPSIDLTKMTPVIRPTVCCPEAAEYCGENSCKDDPPAKGFVYNDARASGMPVQIRGEPSAGASSVGTLPNGARLQYTEARRIGGQTWFHVKNPGGQTGWLSGQDASCQRPYFPPPGKPVIVKPSGIPLATPSSAQAGARG